MAAAECVKYKGWFTGHIEYAYDAGRLVDAVITLDDKNPGTISYKYDPAGRLVSERWSFDNGKTQTYTYEYELVI